jgi:hypothetical protein
VKSKSKWLIVIFILIGIFLFAFINQSSKHTTFGVVMTEMLEGEPIHKIMMSDVNGKKAFDISDAETINSLIEAHSEIELKKEDEVYEPLYNMSVYTEGNKIYSIKVNQKTVFIGGNSYSVKGENVFYQIVEEIYKQQN